MIVKGNSNRDSLRLLVLTILLLLQMSSCVLMAQTEPEQLPPEGRDVTLVITGDQRPRLRLAFPAMEGAQGFSPRAREAGTVLQQTLLGDLRESGVFEIQDPNDLAFLALTGDLLRDLELYRSLGNEILLLGELREEAGRIVLLGRLYDLKSGQSILGKRYRGEFALARRIAHTFADEIALYFTGRRGIALTTIAFTSDRDGFKEIYLMDADGHGQRRITGHKSTSMSPDWSPAGGALAYISFFEGPPGIFLVDLESGRKIPMISDGTQNTSPAYAPDGKTVAFARSLTGNSEIFVATVDGGNLKRLTHSAGIDTNPAWSPSGREIAFTSSRSGSPQIYVMDADGTNLRRLSFEGNYNDGAAWNPDGTKIAYASRRRSTFDIALTDVATLETVLVTMEESSDESPTFSPDGRKIAFSRTRGRRTQIWVMNQDGTDQRQVTTEGNNSSPDWSAYPTSSP